MKWSKQRKHEILMQVTNNLLDTVKTTEPDLKKVVDDAGHIICYICDICKAIFADTTGSPRYLHVRVCREKQAVAQQHTIRAEVERTTSDEQSDLKQDLFQFPDWGNDESDFDNGLLTEGHSDSTSGSPSHKRTSSATHGVPNKRSRMNPSTETTFDQLFHDLESCRVKSSTFSAGESKILEIVQSQVDQIKFMNTKIDDLTTRFNTFVSQENRRHNAILREILTIKNVQDTSDSDHQNDNALPSMKNSITEDFTPSYQFISLKRVVELRHCAVLDEQLFATSVAQAIVVLEDYLTYRREKITPKLIELRKIICTFGKVTIEEELAAKEEMIHRIMETKKRSLIARFQHCAKQSPINFAIGSNLWVVAPAIEVEGRYYPQNGSAHYAHKFNDKDELLSPFPALARSEEGLQRVKVVFVCEKLTDKQFTFKMLNFDDFTISEVVV